MSAGGGDADDDEAVAGPPCLRPVAALAAALPATATAAGSPQTGAIWTTGVKAAGATFHGEIDPEGSATTYRFEYLTDAAYQANPPAERFNGAAKAPAGPTPPSAGSSTSLTTVSQAVSALRANTVYHYQLTATNGSGSTSSSEATFLTQEFGGGPTLLDERGWEMVSPPEKNGGAIQGPEQIHGGGVLQAAPTGEGEITYSSASSFGGYEAQGAPPASQYISRHIEAKEEYRPTGRPKTSLPPTVSGTYGNEPNGVPYQLYSPDLARALMLNGIHCRGEGTDCPVANPPLPGTGAPEGFQDYYLRDNGNGAYTALLTESNAELH